MVFTGKYDPIVSQALTDREPVARVMRDAGFTEREIRSCQCMLPRIKTRLGPEDPAEWQERKRKVYLTRKRVALERLESGKSKSEAGDLHLVESYDRALIGIEKGHRTVRHARIESTPILL